MAEAETINQRIKRILKENNITQLDLANSLGVTRTSINERLNSEKQIDSFEFFIAVSALTRLSITSIYYGENNSKAQSSTINEPNRYTKLTFELEEVKQENKLLKDTLDQISILIKRAPKTS